MSDFDELDDFEAQLARMNDDIDSQFSAALSAHSSADSISDQHHLEDEFESATPPQVSQDDFALATDYNNQSRNNNNINIPSHHLTAEDVELSFTDIEFDTDNEDSLEGKSLVQKHTHVGIPVHQLTDSQRVDGKEATGKKGGCADKECNSCDSGPSIEDQLYEKELKEQEAQEAKWQAEYEKYQEDNSLSGFIFKLDLDGFKASLASGAHHPHEFDYRGEHTALHHAVFHDQIEFIQELFKYGCDVNVRNFRGETALMLASKLEDTGLKMMALLVEDYGADIHAKDYVGLHALHHAAEQGRVWNLSLLHTVYGVDINIGDIYNKNALHWAAWAGHVKVCEWLLRHGASPYVQDTVGCYAIHWASAKSRVDVMQLLAQFDATDGQNVHLKTVAEKTYTKHVRKRLYGDKHDYNQSPFVNDPESIRYDPNLQRNKQRRARLDKNNIDRYDADDTYEVLRTAKHNPIDDIMALSPTEYPGYKSFYDQLATKNNDGLDVEAFVMKKNESLEGIDRHPVNKTLDTLKRLRYASWSSRYAASRAMTNFLNRVGYLPFHFFTLYLIALYLTAFVYNPIIVVQYPNFAWTTNAFYFLWALVIYNWFRIVFTKPGKLEYFTPATSSEHHFGDDGSTTLAIPPPLQTQKFKNINSTASSSMDGKSHDIEEQVSVAPSKAPHERSHNECSGGKGMFAVASLDACSPPNHHIPTQKLTIKEYQSVSTLYTSFVELLTKGDATDSNCCYTCEIVRPVRSKHCGRCGQCVPRFDHHCPFFNQDIAYTNYHNFLWFLILVPCHFAFFMYQHWLLFSTGFITAATLPSFIFTIPAMFGISEKWAMLGFNIFIVHYTMYIIFDAMLFSQHIYLLTDGLTTNELMNRQRYSYLQINNLPWNPFSRGTFMYNLLAGLAMYKHKEPLCLSDNQSQAIGFCKSPLDLTSEWARSVKEKFSKKKSKKNKKQPQQQQTDDQYIDQYSKNDQYDIPV